MVLCAAAEYINQSIEGNSVSVVSRKRDLRRQNAALRAVDISPKG